MAIKAITFDFWCTLFRDANGEARQTIRVNALAEASGESRERAAEALTHSAREFQRHHANEQRTLDPKDAVRIAGEYLGVDLQNGAADQLEHVFATAILHYSPVPIAGALRAVRAAAAQYPVGIISDSGLSPGFSLRRLLDRYGFTGYFGVTVFSDEIGVSKPQRRMFEKAAEGLGVQPDELLHIGDLEWTDVKGALDVGSQAALFGGDNAKHVGNTKANHTFLAWQEFEEKLPALS